MSGELSFDDVVTAATAKEWLAKLLDDTKTLGIRATSWQAGAIPRTIYAVVAEALRAGDTNAAILGMAGFLDFAATESVTYTDPKTGAQVIAPVTPEGGPGALDVLASSVYNVQRILLTFAGGTLAICNTSGSTYTLDAGTYHVTNPNTKQGYTNTTDIVVTPSSLVGGTITAIGSYFGACEITTSGVTGLFTGTIVTILGVAGIPGLAGATAWKVRPTGTHSFVLLGSTFSGSYTSGGTARLPTLAAVKADVGGSVGNSLDASGVANVQTITQPVTSLIGVSVTNPVVYLGTDVESNVALAARCRLKLQSLSNGGPKGAYEFFALASQQYAPKLNPPESVGAAITRARPIPDKSNGWVYVFLANPAGPPAPEDVQVTDDVLQAYAAPQTDTAIAIAATVASVSCAATVFLPAPYATDANRIIFEGAVQAYFSTLPIGGVSDPGGAYTNIVPLQGIADAIFDAARDHGLTIQNIVVQLNGAQLDVQLIVNTSLLRADVAVLVPAVPAITLEGV
jgi:hypothetical protein